MRATGFVLTLLLASVPLVASAGDPAPGPGGDARYPVQVSPEEANRQKTEMRSNLVALRETLDRLANKDFPGVEIAVRRLSHEGPLTKRPGASTKVFGDLERSFEASVDRTIQATRSGSTEVVLRSLSETMGYCHSCHMAFREAVAAEGTGDAGKKP